MAISTDDVKKLAELSRLALTDAEVEKLRGEIDSILAYVDAIQKISLPEGVAASPHLDLQNVLRADENPIPGGTYTKEINDQFPDSEDGYLRVRKILG